MVNDLQAIPEGMNLPTSKFANADAAVAAFKDIAGSGKYLARVQLMGATSKLASSGKVNVGQYVVIRTETDFNVLGPSWDGVAFAWRPKAMHIGQDAILNYYDPEDKEFIKITESADAPGGFDRGDSYGPEFLMWVPKFKTYAGLYMASKTARRESAALMTILSEKSEQKKLPAATFKSHLIKGKKNNWWGPIITECSAPITPLPEWEKHAEVVDKFLNPPKNETEKAEETGRDR